MSVDIIIRPEEPQDMRAAEELTRAAFWNKYRPGCMEHYILHRYRSLPGFRPELTCVLEENGSLSGHIMYCDGSLAGTGGEKLPILIFGPVSISPERQGLGLGARLIGATLEKAAAMGHGAVAITGAPEYYRRFGFVPGADMGVRYVDMPIEEDASFFMVKELKPGYLSGRSWVYNDPVGYFADQALVEEFDKSFPPREKLTLPGQL